MALPLLWPLAALAVSLPSTNILAPPLPPQPGRMAPACQPAASTPGSWTEVYAEIQRHPGGAWPAYPGDFPSYQITVDPANPCRMYRAGSDAQSVNRSSDG